MKKEDIVQVGNHSYEVIIDPEFLKMGVHRIANRIKTDYLHNKKPPIIISIANGGLYFGVWLSIYLEKYNFFHEIDIIKTQRYTEDKLAREIKIINEPSINLKGRDVIIVEDLIDEGVTLNFINSYLLEKNPKSIQYAVVLIKNNHVKLNFEVKYYIKNNIDHKRWLIGFGMDSNGLYRGLNFVCSKKDTS